MASFHEEPKPGDLIEISRIGSSHWALYVGDGDVVHLAPTDEHSEVDSSSMSSMLSPRLMVKRELLSDVVGSCGYCINNHLDLECSPLPVNKIISSVEEMVGKEMVYGILSRKPEHFVTYLRYGTICNQKFHEEPRPGDLIEIPRIGSSHWALYVGDGYVVHLAPPDEYPGADSSSMSSMLSPRGKVKRELLRDVVGGCGYRVNNYLDLECSPLPVNKIISSAEEMVGEEMEYSLVKGNFEHFVTNLRYGKALSPEFHNQPRPGDLIEIPHMTYSHWALYVGDGYVVHLAPTDEFPWSGSSSILSVNSSRGMVKRELLSDVVGGRSYRVNNHLDRECSPLPVNKIISSAEEMVGKEIEYSLVNRNCEHFVTDLRYGKARSLQVELVKTNRIKYIEKAALTSIACSAIKKLSQHQ